MNNRLLIALGLLSGTVSAVALADNSMRFAEPNPPMDIREQASVFVQPQVWTTAVPVMEWTYHRTADGQHPNGDEQALVWFMNRARQNPTAEGEWLAVEPDPYVASARSYFNVNIGILKSEFANYAARPPAAFDNRLYQAAKAHSEDMIARDAQDHNNQFDRVDAAGFRYTAARGNVFSYAKSALHAHAGFNIDWGPGDGTGMQPERGHRYGIMSLDRDYSNVGIAVLPENDSRTEVGPLVVTGNYASAQTNGTDHFNNFVVGTVWQDRNSNGRYDSGEGYPNVLVQPSQGTYFATTSAGGGYAIPITATGSTSIKFSGGGVAEATRTVNLASTSVLLDYQVGSGETPQPPPTNQAVRLTNISTRGWVGTGDSVMIGGFIISGSAGKKVLITAKGPSLAAAGVPSSLANPNITLHNASGQVILSNDDYGSAANAAEIAAHSAAPRNSLESAILTTLQPGAYTAIVRGAGSTTGNALVEVYDLDTNNPNANLVNISTRGWVGTGDSVMIGGFIISGSASKKVLITAKGPSLAAAGVPSLLANPNITLHNDSRQVILSNDDWASAANAAEIAAHPAAPQSGSEAAMLTTLQPGAYTAIVRGAGSTTGNALVEVYEVQ